MKWYACNTKSNQAVVEARVLNFKMLPKHCLNSLLDWIACYKNSINIGTKKDYQLYSAHVKIW